MKNYILALLRKHGPSSSSELIKLIMKEGVQEATARQRITRARSGYRRLAGLILEKRARFIYLPEQYGTPEYWEALERVLRDNGKSYWGAIAGLKSRGGWCVKAHFPIVCGAPIGRQRQLPPDLILERLIAIKLLKEVSISKDSETYITFNPGYYSHCTLDFNEKRALSIAENVAINAILEWARKIGFGSYGKFLTRSGEPLPIVSSIAWDISAPSYIRPLTVASQAGVKPGFFVCDVNLNDIIGIDAVTAFLRKYDMASAPENVAPILPFFIANGFDQLAFDTAKSAGIVVTTIDHLLGRDVSKALQDLIQLLGDTGNTASVNPGKLEEVLNKLTTIEGVANNLRGDLFEFVVGSLIKSVEKGYLKIGQEITHYVSGKKAELDVTLDYPNSNRRLIVECKAKSPGAMVSLEEVKKWYADRIPMITEILESSTPNEERSIRFELWSNGLFHPRALDWLKNELSSEKQWDVGWRDGKEMKEYVRRAKNKTISNILNQHYFKHPLTKLVRDT